MATEKKQKPLSDWGPQAGAPIVPLAVQLNMAGERTAPVAPPPPPSKPVLPLLLGVVVGAVVTGVTLMLVSPTVVPSPIVIVSAGAAVPPAPPLAAAPKPVVAAPKPVEAAPKPAPVAAAAPQPKPAEKEKEKQKEKGPAMADLFAKAAVDPSAPVELTQEKINEVIASHRPATGACAEAQRTAAPDTSGSVTVKWNVEHEGKVNSVQAVGELAESDFATCLVKEIKTWTFPKHDTPHPPVQATFKF